MVLTHGIPPTFPDGVHSFISSTAIGSIPSLYQLSQLRTDGVHCREPAGTGPVVFKVVRVTAAAFSGITNGLIFVRLSFSKSTVGILLEKRTYMCDLINSGLTRRRLTV